MREGGWIEREVNQEGQVRETNRSCPVLSKFYGSLLLVLQLLLLLVRPLRDHVPILHQNPVLTDQRSSSPVLPCSPVLPLLLCQVKCPFLLPLLPFIYSLSLSLSLTHTISLSLSLFLSFSLLLSFPGKSNDDRLVSSKHHP